MNSTRLLLCALLFSVLHVPVGSARLADDEARSELRYGATRDPNVELNDRNFPLLRGPDAVTRTYLYRGWRVRIGFLHGVAVREEYWKAPQTGMSREIGDDEVADILGGESALGWQRGTATMTVPISAFFQIRLREIGVNDAWVRGDGGAVAKLDMVRMRLSLESEAAARYEQSQKPPVHSGGTHSAVPVTGTPSRATAPPISRAPDVQRAAVPARRDLPSSAPLPALFQAVGPQNNSPVPDGAAAILTIFTFLFAVIGVIACLTVLPRFIRAGVLRCDWTRRRFGQDGTLADAGGYALCTYVLTRRERIFYEALHEAVRGAFLVGIKIRLADIVQVTGTAAGDATRVEFHRIAMKHVDFLLIDRRHSRPVMAIELDDETHDMPDRIARDAFVDRLFRAVGLPILHQQVNDQGYSRSGLFLAISGLMKRSSRLVLLLLFVFAFAVPLEARLGDNQSQFDLRFGRNTDPNWQAFDRANPMAGGPGITTCTYFYRGWRIRVAFFRDFAAREEYSKPSNGGQEISFTDAEVFDVLGDESADQQWRSVPNAAGKEWIRADGAIRTVLDAGNTRLMIEALAPSSKADRGIAQPPLSNPTPELESSPPSSAAEFSSDVTTGAAPLLAESPMLASATRMAPLAAFVGILPVVALLVWWIIRRRTAPADPFAEPPVPERAVTEIRGRSVLSVSTRARGRVPKGRQ